MNHAVDAAEYPQFLSSDLMGWDNSPSVGSTIPCTK